MPSKGGFEVEFEGDGQPREHFQQAFLELKKRSLDNLVQFSEKTEAQKGYDFPKLLFAKPSCLFNNNF